MNMDPSIAPVVWPGENEASARALVQNLDGLRKKTTKDFIKYLNLVFVKQVSKDVALAVFGDDDTKMALVQHVPTEFLWKLGAYRMGTARKASEESTSSQERADVVDMKFIVDGQLTEFQKLLKISSEEIKRSLIEMREIKGVVTEMAKVVNAHRAESKTWGESLSSLMGKVFGYVSQPQSPSHELANAIHNVDTDLKGFIIDMKGVPRTERLKTDFAKQLAGFQWSGK